MTRLLQHVPGRQWPWKLCAFAGALIPAHSTQAYVPIQTTSKGYGQVPSPTQMTKQSMSQDGQTQGRRLDLPALLPVPNRKTLRTFHAPLSEWSFVAAAQAGCGRERTGAPAAAGDAPHAGCGNAVRPRKAAATSTMDGQRAAGRHPHPPTSPSIPSPTSPNPPRSIPQNHLQTLWSLHHAKPGNPFNADRARCARSSFVRRPGPVLVGLQGAGRLGVSLNLRSGPRPRHDLHLALLRPTPAPNGDFRP